MFVGLYEWVNAAWVLDDPPVNPADKLNVKYVPAKPKWIRRRRPVLQALGIVIATHVFGLVLFSVLTSTAFVEQRTVCNFQPLHYI